MDNLFKCLYCSPLLVGPGVGRSLGVPQYHLVMRSGLSVDCLVNSIKCPTYLTRNSINPNQIEKFAIGYFG